MSNRILTDQNGRSDQDIQIGQGVHEFGLSEDHVTERSGLAVEHL